MHPAADPLKPDETPEGRPDHVLLALTRSGDRAAAGELYERYARRLRDLAAHRTAGGPIEPDDVVQSAFRTFLAGVGRGLYDVPDGQDLWALLVVVALNKVRAYARSASAAKRAAAGCPTRPPRRCPTGGPWTRPSPPRPRTC